MVDTAGAVNVWAPPGQSCGDITPGGLSLAPIRLVHGESAINWAAPTGMLALKKTFSDEGPLNH